LTDLYGYGGNPDLDPERSFNIEAGVRRRFDGGHALSLSAFRNEIDDLIEFVVLSYDPFAGQNRNVDRARIDGIGRLRHASGRGTRSNLPGTRPDDGNCCASPPVSRLRYPSFSRVDLNSRLATGERKTQLPQRVTLDSYVLANVTAR
jgi:hypothetical protein